VDDAEVEANPRAARGPRRLVAVASALMCVVDVSLCRQLPVRRRLRVAL